MTEGFVVVNNNNVKRIINIFKVIFGGLLMAISLKIFVNNANIVPAGFTGITVLVQRIWLKIFNTELPFAPINILLNLPAAFVSLKMIGKRYTITSFLVLIELSLLTDMIPSIVISDDILILTVFGAIFNAFGCALIYSAGTSGGGTDFIAMSMSNKYHISVFGYVMIFNMMLIVIQGFLFGFNSSFYSIIYQYISTQVINMRYKHYEKKTLLIISDMPDEISKAIISEFPHSLTKIVGEGCYTHEKKNILYTVTTDPELRKTISVIKNVDKYAFINIIDSKEVSGNFNYLSVDIPENKFSV